MQIAMTVLKTLYCFIPVQNGGLSDLHGYSYRLYVHQYHYKNQTYQLQIFASYGSIVDGSSPQWSFLIIRRVWKEKMYGVTTHPLFCPHWAISVLLFCNPLSCLYSI